MRRYEPEQLAALAAAAGLTEPEAEALRLRMADHSWEEIARETGTDVGQVGEWLLTGEAKVRAALDTSFGSRRTLIRHILAAAFRSTPSNPASPAHRKDSYTGEWKEAHLRAPYPTVDDFVPPDPDR